MLRLFLNLFHPELDAMQDPGAMLETLARPRSLLSSDERQNKEGDALHLLCYGPHAEGEPRLLSYPGKVDNLQNFLGDWGHPTKQQMEGGVNLYCPGKLRELLDERRRLGASWDRNWDSEHHRYGASFQVVPALLFSLPLRIGSTKKRALPMNVSICMVYCSRRSFPGNLYCMFAHTFAARSSSLGPGSSLQRHIIKHYFQTPCMEYNICPK